MLANATNHPLGIFPVSGEKYLRDDTVNTCHLCGGALPHHHDNCRVHKDLELFVRVFRRLRAQERNPVLQDKIVHQLARHGRLNVEEAA